MQQCQDWEEHAHPQAASSSVASRFPAAESRNSGAITVLVPDLGAASLELSRPELGWDNRQVFETCLCRPPPTCLQASLRRSFCRTPHATKRRSLLAAFWSSTLCPLRSPRVLPSCKTGIGGPGRQGQGDVALAIPHVCDLKNLTQGCCSGIAGSR